MEGGVYHNLKDLAHLPIKMSCWNIRGVGLCSRIA